MSKIRVRIRGPQGVHTLDLLSSSTVSELNEEIRSKSGLNGPLDCEFTTVFLTYQNWCCFDLTYACVLDIIVRIGYPPKALDLTSCDSSATLDSLPFKLNGEQIIVAQSASDESRSLKPISQTDKIGSQNATKAPKDKITPAKVESSVFSNTRSSFRDTTDIRGPKNDKQNQDDMDMEPPVIQVSTHPGQSLVLRIMEDDNSCLFRAINYVFMRSIDTMQELRSLVAQTIQSDATLPPAEQQYGDAMLGMSRDDYCQKIQRSDVWGGGIELAILSKYIDLEVSLHEPLCQI